MTSALTPEARAGIWSRLSEMAGSIGDAETRAQYLGAWRARFDAEVSAPTPGNYDDLEFVPDGRLAGCTPEERARLRLIGATWVDHALVTANDSPEALELFAWGLGRRVSAGLLDEGDAESALALTNWAGGLDEEQERARAVQLSRSIDAGKRKGYDAWSIVLALRCAAFQRSDLGNAERFRARYGDEFRFTTAKGWLGWDGRRWRVLDQEADSTPAEVQAAVFATVRGIQDEARAVRNTGYGDPEDLEYWMKNTPIMRNGEKVEPVTMGLNRFVVDGAKIKPLHAAIAKWGVGSESASKLSCIPGLAKRWLTVPIEHFDTDPLSINCLNGTLRFRRARREDGGFSATVDLSDHRREDLNTRLAPVTYDPDAPRPIFEATFIWAQPKAEMQRYIRQWAGYSLSGLTGEQLLQFWYGLGANAKSTIFDALAEAAGDYSGTIGIETFLDQGIKKRGDQATPDLARLGGVRMLRASEPDRGAKLNEALIKAATGGEPMAVRALHKGFFDLRPLFKLTIQGNHRPDVPGTDEGIWRRLKLVPWEQFREEADRDRHLPQKLKRELNGILAWMVEGLLDYLEHGFVEPDTVTAATADYRDDSDPLARFLRLCTRVKPDGRVQSSKLHEVFAAWAKAAGEVEWKPKGFASAMKAKGFTNKTSNGVQWLGLELTKSVGDFIDADGRVVNLAGMAEEHVRDARKPVGREREAPPDDHAPAPDIDDDDDDILPNGR